jgi:nucleotide-binding universal stress UspA family protein
MTMDTHAISDAVGHETILVPLDGSGASEAALPLAAVVARASNATIHLVRVHDPLVTSVDIGFPLPDFEREIRQSELDHLAGIARRFVTDSRVPTATQLLDGAVGPAIKDYVQRIGATLVVISTHGRTGLNRMWLGSTADWLMRFLPVPVLAVRPRDEPWTRAPSLEHVLIALDGSARSEAVIPAAMRVGRPSGARYTLLQVVPTSVRELVSYATRSFPPLRDERRTMELMRSAKSRLDDVARSMRRELGGSAVTAEVVADEYVAEAILERARRDGVGLIALSIRGRGGSRLLVGSVADKVLRGFTGALLVLGPVAAQELESDELPIDQRSAVGLR